MDQLKPAKLYVQLSLSCLHMAVLSNIEVNMPLKILELLEVEKANFKLVLNCHL